MTKYGEKGSTNKNKMGSRTPVKNLLCLCSKKHTHLSNQNVYPIKGQRSSISRFKNNKWTVMTQNAYSVNTYIRNATQNEF